MNGRATVLAGFALAAGAAAWAWNSGSSAHLSAARGTAVASISQPPHAPEGRLYLTKAQLDQALATGTLDRPVKSLLDVPAPIHFGDYAWNEAAVPAGATWIRIDLRSQLISVFRAGHEIGTAVIVYGGDNKETPVGKLHILAKARDHRSSVYDAEMPYTLRLTNDGVSIHASSVRWGAATHGCIGVPLGFAERLFNASRIGDEVEIVGQGAASNRSS